MANSITYSRRHSPSLPPPSLPQVQFQSALQELAGQTSQRRREVDRMASQCANYEIIARSLKEQNEVLNGRVVM